MRGGPINVGALEALQGVLQRFIKAHQDNDVETQHDILRQLIEREQAAYQRKLKLLAELKTLMQEARAEKGTQNRVISLIEAFKFAANLRAIGYDELDDRETATKATRAAQDAFNQLEAIVPQNSIELLDLLSDPSPAVRATAGAHLLRTAPERAVPVLEDIDQNGSGNPSFSAWFSLARYRAEMGSKP